MDLPLFTHQSLNFSKISGSHCAGVHVVSLIFTQLMCNMHKNMHNGILAKRGSPSYEGSLGGVFCMLGVQQSENSVASMLRHF